MYTIFACISPPLKSMTKVKNVKILSKNCPKNVVLPYVDMIFMQSSKLAFQLSIPLVYVNFLYSDLNVVVPIVRNRDYSEGG